MIQLKTIQTDKTCFGFCAHCGMEHSLGEGNARVHAMRLMQELKGKRRIDLAAEDSNADPRFSTDYLFGRARGQMFGVLECEDQQGNKVILKAFSCQYNGVWEVEGWVPPLLSVQAYDDLV